MSNYTHFEYKAGLSQVGQYQASGVPYVSSSITVPKVGQAPLEVPLPKVTRFFTVQNTSTVTGASLRVGFSSLGVTGSGKGAGGAGTDNYFVLDIGQSYTAEMKVSKLFLLGHTNIQTSASVIAGLTGIDTGSLQNNWSGSTGVG